MFWCLVDKRTTFAYNNSVGGRSDEVNFLQKYKGGIRMKLNVGDYVKIVSDDHCLFGITQGKEYKVLYKNIKLYCYSMKNIADFNGNSFYRLKTQV